MSNGQGVFSNGPSFACGVSNGHNMATGSADIGEPWIVRIGR